MSVILGIDLGTSGVKVLAIDEGGEVLASAAESYPLIQPQAGWSEQDPDAWWHSTCTALRTIVTLPGLRGRDIIALAISGQMHGSVFLDVEGEVIRNPLLWNDTRTFRQCEQITELLGEEKLISMVGNPALEGFTAPKLMWLRDHEPKNYERLATLMLPKDYIVYRFTERRVTEMSDAAGTLLLDVKERRWSEALLSRLDIRAEILPELLESIDIVDTLSETAAEATGLPRDLKVIAGGADNACGAVGSGIVSEGLYLASIGSSGVILAHCDEMQYDPAGRIHSFNHSLPRAWYVMGVMLSAGMSMSWYRDTLHISDLDVINREASTIDVGSDGVIFLPYLHGERTPHRDPHARGVFFGLAGTHDRGHLSRAVFEGVGFGLKDSLTLISDLGVKPQEVRITGGGARSSLWRQIMADIFNEPVLTLQSDEGPAYGAALIAAVGGGIYADIKTAVNETVHTTSATDPVPEHVEVYKHSYERYRSLYTALEPEFRR